MFLNDTNCKGLGVIVIEYGSTLCTNPVPDDSDNDFDIIARVAGDTSPEKLFPTTNCRDLAVILIYDGTTL